MTIRSDSLPGCYFLAARNFDSHFRNISADQKFVAFVLAKKTLKEQFDLYYNVRSEQFEKNFLPYVKKQYDPKVYKKILELSLESGIIPNKVDEPKTSVIAKKHDYREATNTALSSLDTHLDIFSCTPGSHPKLSVFPTKMVGALRLFEVAYKAICSSPEYLPYCCAKKEYKKMVFDMHQRCTERAILFFQTSLSDVDPMTIYKIIYWKRKLNLIETYKAL